LPKARVREASSFNYFLSPHMAIRIQQEEKDKEFTEKVLEVNRVTRVVKGGKRINFRALVVVGDGKGRVGFGLGKAADVSEAISKAVRSAKAELVHVYLEEGTIPYQVLENFKSASVLLKPAQKGTGIIAGGTARVVLELAGLSDIVAKSLGSSNKIAVTQATINALAGIKNPAHIMAARGKAKA
jgi:small subunit ribosomal protein S5